MSVDKQALANMQKQGFNFVDENSNDVDFDNINEDGKFIFRHGQEVIQDNMSAKMMVDTVNNEFGTEVNV